MEPPTQPVQFPVDARRTQEPASLSALLTVYRGTVPAEFRECFASVLAQSRLPEHIVIVRDGPVSPELESLLDDAAATAEVPTHVLRQERNAGAGAARQAGFTHIGKIGDSWTAIVDTDDVCLPLRFATQLDYVTHHPELDVLGSAVAEFIQDPSQPEGIRRLPESHDALLRYARMNSPMNNGSVLVRTAAVRAIGGVRPLQGMEDYALWARMLGAGYRFHNLPEPLYAMRVTPNTLARRSQPGMMRSELTMQWILYHAGLIGWPRAAVNFVLRTAYRALPISAVQRLYPLLFRWPGRQR